jgi:hypothetical protein
MIQTISIHVLESDATRAHGHLVMGAAHVQLAFSEASDDGMVATPHADAITLDLFLNGTPDEQWAVLDTIIDACVDAKKALTGDVALDPDPLTVQ